MGINDIDAALKLFEENAIKHTDASAKGDYKTANNCHYKISKAVAFLKQQSLLPLLLRFLSHPSGGVQLFAATYLLGVNEKESGAVLKKLATGKGILSLSAETTLSEWKKGNLKL